MAKYEQIDRLIDQAVKGSSAARKTDPAPPVENENGTGEQAKKQEERRAEPATAAPTAELLIPKMTQAERTRQILGALRPFLPVVGGALRLIDHGAAQAASRLLPLLVGAGPVLSSNNQAENAAVVEAGREAMEAVEKERTAMRADLALCKEQLRSQEERLMKLRDALTRTLADQDTMQLSMRRLADRNRLLTGGVVILLMLVVAEIVLLLLNVRL